MKKFKTSARVSSLVYFLLSGSACVHSLAGVSTVYTKTATRGVKISSWVSFLVCFFLSGSACVHSLAGVSTVYTKNCYQGGQNFCFNFSAPGWGGGGEGITILQTLLPIKPKSIFGREDCTWQAVHMH